MNHTPAPAPAWQEAIFKVLKEGGVNQIAYVPDAGHSHVIRSAIADPDIQDVVLTTEEEGVAVAGSPAWRVCLAGMPAGEVAGQRHYDTPANVPDALVVHGERDERVPLASVFDWARPQVQPVVVVPGADHFFTGRLHILRALVLSRFAG